MGRARSDDVENEHLNVLEIVVSHRVDDHIEDDTLCRTDVDPTIVKDRLYVMSLTTSSTMGINTCHMQATTTNYSDEPCIMSSSYPCNNFLETNAMFLEFADDLDNLTGGSLLVGENSVGSSSQPPMTPTLKRRVQSRFLELEHYVAANGRILMTIAPGAEKPIFPHVVRFSQAIGVYVRKTFLVCCLKWVDVGREYIEVVKVDLQALQKVQDPEEARANPPNLLEQSQMNKVARQKYSYNHSNGSKSFPQRQHELAAQREEPVDRVELF
ncbi:CACTA en-spm transposon protein [Cucumis melo var. makuwa]|uniref:CACTA en-spm transposon protein n=1 Tax=Cucumis melo var. makuwa TaxID=1194695 RepID=A0A5A7UQB1_CUCMM|nr:CACTA en-spm transposon protein [Cucumis melo var. makuwa]TYJ99938.1 CACTA en-spm transposon protein [Cucumis melo var. makuwa]